MESAPLTLAHTHARNALLETRKSNPVAASEEHDLAAGEFAQAAQSTGDAEALRTLQLLEQHHKKLSQILKFRHDNPPSVSSTDFKSPEPLAQNPSPLPAEATPSPKSPRATPETLPQPPRLPTHQRVPPRDLTSSIASNLASARGIPSGPQRRGAPVSPTLSAQHAPGKISGPPARSKLGEATSKPERVQSPSNEKANRATPAKQPWSPPTFTPAEDDRTPEARDAVKKTSQTATSDEPFQRFYSTFEGLISKLSAPLAFAGLPLSSTEAPAPGPESAQPSKKPSSPSSSMRATAAEPDLNRLISRAALRAVKDTNGISVGNAAESFYVVPTTGGTISYAGILSRAEQEARRNSNDHGHRRTNTEGTDDGEMDDFVDARSSPPSPELLLTKLGHARTRSNNDPNAKSSGGKNLEELQLENTALKHLSDTLSKRLHMWEVNAQSSSMALQQSLRQLQNASDKSPRGSTTMAAGAPPPLQAAAGATSPPPKPQGQEELSSGPTPQKQKDVGPSEAEDAAQKRVKELEDAIAKSEREMERVARENEKLKGVVGRYRERWEKLKEGARVRREVTGETREKGGGE